MAAIKSYAHALLLLAMLVSLTAAATASTVTALPADDATTNQFCSTLSTRKETALKQLKAKTSTINSKWSQQDGKLVVLVRAHDTEIEKQRGDIDAKRSANITALRAKAHTAAERTAVDAYAAQLAQTIQARRQAVDTARSHFRSGIKTELKNRQVVRSGQLLALNIAVSDAFDAAANTCNDGNAQVARTNLVQSLAGARQQFHAEQSSNPSAQTLRNLQAVRAQTVKAANDMFAQQVAAAQQALQSGLHHSLQ